MKEDEKIKVKLKSLLLQRANYKDEVEFEKHFNECARFLFEAKEIWPIKEDFLNEFQTIFNDIDNNYWSEISLEENANFHQDFIDNIAAFIQDYYPPIKFWDKTYDEYLKIRNRNTR